MLNLSQLVRGYNESARGFVELLPFMALWDDATVITNDQGMMSCYTFDGQDAEGRSIADLSHAVNAYEKAFQGFGSGSTVWSYIDRRRTTAYPTGRYESAVAEHIDSVWRQEITSQQYENSYSLAVHQRATEGAMAVFDVVDLLVKENGYGYGKALLEAVKQNLSSAARSQLDARRAKASWNALQEKIVSMESALPSMGLKKLSGSALMAFLYNRVSPASPHRDEYPLPTIPNFLSNLICDNSLRREMDHLVFRNEDSKYVGVVSLKGFAGDAATVIGQLDWLATIQGEVTVSHCFRFVDREVAQKTIEDIEKYNMSKSVPFMHRIVSSLSKQEPSKFNEGRLALAQDAKAALVDLYQSGRTFGHHNLTVLCFGDTYEEMRRVRSQVLEGLRFSRFIGHVERQHVLSAFQQTIPGNWNAGVRWNFVSYGNAADLAPIRTLRRGPDLIDHFTKEFQRPFPALTSVPTTSGSPTFIDLWEKGVGHLKIIGPTRSGKSTICNFLLSQFRKYEPCRTIVIDKDYSCRVPTLLQDGVHIDLNRDAKNGAKMSPMGLVGDPDHHPFVVNWLIDLIESGRNGVTCSPQEIEVITKAVRGLAELSEEYWTLSYIVPGLQSLGVYLGRWVQGGADGHWFDNPPEEVETGRHICFECKDLFENKTVASLAMSYLFYLIEGLLDDTPTIVSVEETWFFLDNERFAAKIDNFIRTLGKRNGSLWMVTQNLQEIRDCSIASSIMSNVPNTLFLPDRSIGQFADLYRDFGGLMDEEIQRISEAIEKRHYYLKTPNSSRMLEMAFPQEIVVCISSGSRVRRIFDEHYNNRDADPNWQDSYYKSVTSSLYS